MQQATNVLEHLMLAMHFNFFLKKKEQKTLAISAVSHIIAANVFCASKKGSQERM